mgnify:FL=1
MSEYLTEDEVRETAGKILGFNKIKNVKSGVGQITTFNQLGIKGKGKDKKPDGWYLPKDKGAIAIILETKNSNEDIGKKKWIDEIKQNCQIVMDAGYTHVIGLLHNGYKTTGFKNNNPIDVSNELQEKEYYFKYFTEECIDKECIYTLTARINNCLHSEFGIKNLYHRMIFTACALVAKRFQAPLVAGMDYDTFKTCIKSTLKRELKDSQKENQKIELLWQVNDEIKMNSTENQEAIDNFIKWVGEISDCLNSNKWRGEDVMGIFFNEFNRYKKKTDAGQIFTPDHITSFMYRLINVSQHDNVGDFTCGSGAFLVKSMSNMIEEAGGVNTRKAKDIKAKQLYGIEFDREIYALACANMLIHKDGKTNLEHLDTRSKEACEWIKSKPITKVLMNPPYENKYGCIEIVKNVLDNVKKGTDCAFILPDKKLEKVSQKIVKNILENHRLKMIIKLPEPLFFGVGVTTSIFVFKAGEPQNDQEIFGCYIKDDGLETVKNQGRHDIKNKWQDIEDYWIDSINKLRDEKYNTAQWIKPPLTKDIKKGNQAPLSYQMPERPFEIFEEDFRKTAMDYLMFKNGIEVKEFGEKLLNSTMYSSNIEDKNNHIYISLNKGSANE